MPKDKRSRKLKTYGFKVVMEGYGELKAPRPIPQDKVLKMAREKLDDITDGTLADFTMSVSPLTLIQKIKKPKSPKPKKPKKQKGRKASKDKASKRKPSKRKASKRKSSKKKKRAKQGFRIKRKK